MKDLNKMCKFQARNKYSMKLVCTTMMVAPALLVTALAGSAMAQDAKTKEVEQIVVTGTRIKGNVESPSPISVTKSADIQLTKATNVEDVLSKMPGVDFTGGISNATNNGGVGMSQVGLRNLGPTRTLILVDGQRLLPVFSGSSTIPDLNAVPISMVDRLEVLRDGASSSYGADAIGGVINIITKRKSDGLFVAGNYGISGHGDAETYGLNSSIGFNSDRGSMIVALNWDHKNELQQSDRSWATDPHIGDAGNEGGSTWRNQLTVLTAPGGITWLNGAQTTVTDPNIVKGGPNMLFLPGAGRAKLNAGAAGWNDLAGGLDRKQISFNGRYDVTSDVTFIAQGFFTRRESSQSLRPEPLLGTDISTSVNGYPVFAGFIMPAWMPGNTLGKDFVATLTPAQFGPRQYRQTSQTYRVRLGFEGKVFDKYNWDLGYVIQSNETTQKVLNTGNWNHLGQMLGSVPCLDVPGGCNKVTGRPNVQPNWFNGPNIFTPEQVKYLTYTNVDNNSARERYFYANINGPLYTLPAGDITGALGVEHRDEHADDTPDALSQFGWAPNQAAPTSGGYTVDAVYGEIQVPVLKNIPFFKLLNLSLSGRHDEFSSFGNADTYKVGLNWKIDDNLRLRSAYSTGFRAPSTAELYGGQTISFLTASGDPCDSRTTPINGNTNMGKGVLSAGSTCSLAVAGGAAVTSFKADQNEVSTNQTPNLVGGYSKLQAERSRELTAGLIFTPTFLNGFSMAVDYYHITVSNAILTGGISNAASPDLILLGCYGPAQNKAYCNWIHRNAAGAIVQIDSLNTNSGVVRVEGIDYDFGYDTRKAGLSLPFPGSVAVNLTVSNQMKNTSSNPDGSVNRYNGTFNYSNESIQPKWKAQFSADYRSGSQWALHWDTRFIQGTRNLDGSDKIRGNVIKDLYFHNISFAYDLDKLLAARNTRIVVGIDNLFDTKPPFLNGDSVCKCNSIAGPYDFVGRYFYTKFSTSF